MHQKCALIRINIMLIQPKADLYDRVINRINREEKLATLKRRLRLESLGLILSFLVFIGFVAQILVSTTPRQRRWLDEWGRLKGGHYPITHSLC